MRSLEPVEQESFDTTANALKVAMGAQAYQSEFETGLALTLDDGLRLVAATVAQVIPAVPSPISLVTPPPTGTARKTYPAGLSAREVEVLRLVAESLTDAEVAEKLVLSPRTVNAHLQSIYNKIGVNSRSAATRFAVDNGLV